MEAFVVIISLIWGILSLILFFKIWGMTNNVEKFTKIYIREKDIENNLLKSRYFKLIGDKNNLKQNYIKEFMTNVEKSYSIITHDKDATHLSIAGLVDKLKQQYASIGEELPSTISNLKTFGDYYTLIK